MYAAKSAIIEAAIDWVAGSLRRKFIAYIDAETLKSAANYGVFRAWREFDPAKLKVGTFKSYLQIQGRRRAIEGLREEGAICRPCKGTVRKRFPPKPLLSLDAPHSEADSRTLYDVLGDGDPAALDDRDAAAWLISGLPERLKRVVILHFFEGLSLAETARRIPRKRGGNGHGISECRASQLLHEAYSRLRRRAERAKITA